MPRIRISLRTLFLLTTIVALGCYGWLVLPSQRAREFAGAIAAEDFQSADEMFINPHDHFLERWHDECAEFSINAQLIPWSSYQAFTGQRHITANVIYGRPGLLSSYNLDFLVTPRGLNAPLIRSFSGGSMGLATLSGS